MREHGDDDKQSSKLSKTATEIYISTAVARFTGFDIFVLHKPRADARGFILTLAPRVEICFAYGVNDMKKNAEF